VPIITISLYVNKFHKLGLNDIIKKMKTEENFFKTKIILSFLMSLAFIVLGFFLANDYPTISVAMKVFGSFGLVITFSYLAVNLTSWQEDFQEKVKEFFFFWFEIGNTLLIISAVAFSIRFFVLQPFIVRGTSMEPNYHENEILIVNEISYRLGQKPKRGEVIVFKYPRNPSEKFIKRIIALPNETITIKDGYVYLKKASSEEENKLEENYIEYQYQADPNMNQTWTLKENQYFVIGDNRSPTGSLDSRHWGALDRKYIIGKVWIIVWPINDLGFFKAPQYSL